MRTSPVCSGTFEQRDAAPVLADFTHLLFEFRQYHGSKIHTDVAPDAAGDPQQKQSGAAADLQNVPRLKGQYLLNREIDPLPHLVGGNRRSRVAAVPSSDIEPWF